MIRRPPRSTRTDTLFPYTTLFRSDINTDRARKLADETRSMIVPADEIMAAEADVFSPCALGAVLDKDSIGKLKAGIVAGGANNQLATKSDGSHMRTRNILYAPDRSEERSVGKEWVRTCRSRLSPEHKKKK